MNEFIAFPVGGMELVRGEGGMTSGRRAAISSGLGFRFSSSGYLPRRRCQKLKHRSAKVAQILNASPFIYLAVEQLFRVTMWARSSGWVVVVVWLKGAYIRPSTLSIFTMISTLPQFYI